MIAPHRFVADGDIRADGVAVSGLQNSLLRWQNEMLLCRFRIDEDNSLFLGYARPFEDLDVSEACSALVAMSKAVDSYLPPLKEYLSTP